MLVGQTVQARLAQPRQNLLQTIVLALVAGPVEFEMAEKKQQLFKMRFRQPIVDGIQRVRHDVENVLLFQVLRQVVDIRTDFLDLRMLRLRNVQGQDMNLAPAVGKVGGNLFTDESIGQMGDFKAAGDRVVVGNGHVRHPPFLGHAIDLQRFGETLRAGNFFQYPLTRSFRVLRMHMNINQHLNAPYQQLW